MFYHFSKTIPGREEGLDFSAGGDPRPATSAWQGVVTTGRDWVIRLPDDWGPGEYRILAGLYDRRGDGRRAELAGPDDGGRRYLLGRLIAEGPDPAATLVTGTRLLAEELAEVPVARANLGETDFGVARCGGGVRITVEGGADLIVTPLPDGPAFPVLVRPGRVLGRPAAVRRIEALDASGRRLGETPFGVEDDGVRFLAGPGVFSHRLHCAEGGG